MVEGGALTAIHPSRKRDNRPPTIGGGEEGTSNAPRRRGKTGGERRGGGRGGASHLRRPPLPPREERAGAFPRAGVLDDEDAERGGAGDVNDVGNRRDGAPREAGRWTNASKADKFIEDVTNAVGLPKKKPPEGGDVRNTGATDEVTFLRTPALTPERARPNTSAREDVASCIGESTYSFIAASTWSHVAGHSGAVQTLRSPARNRST